MTIEAKVFGGMGGSGKAGGGGGTPKTVEDNLESTTKVRVLDVIGEGEIDGLVDPFGTKTGAFTQNGTQITVNLVNHGLLKDAIVTLDFEENISENKNFTIKSTTNNTFTVESENSSDTDVPGTVNISIRSGRLQSVFLDDVAVMNATGVPNFKNVRYRDRTGTSAQSVIKGYEENSTITSVNTIVTKDNPVTQAISSSTRKVAVVINIPQLQRYKSNGDIVGSKVILSIAYAGTDGVFERFVLRSDSETEEDSFGKKAIIIKGRTGNPYQRRFEFDFDELGLGQITQIRVERRNDDSDDPKNQKSFSFFSLEEIVDQTSIEGIDLTYPNTALVGLQVGAEQFSSVPRRAYRVRGIKVKIPQGVTVDQNNGRIIYPDDYVFIGLLGAAQWTTDPAWCLYDLMTNERYGLGEHIKAENLDIYAFQSASVYCSSLVKKDPNESLGKEPRFSLNVNIQSQQQAYNVINQIASVFRGMPFYSTGSLTLTQDKPTDPSYLFTLANVTEDGFNYEGSSLKTRSTVVIAKYFDMDEREPQYEEVKITDSDIVDVHPSFVDDIDRYGTIIRHVDAFGCTSRFQARRLAKWILLSERLETETVTFTTSVDAGVVVRPGQVIKIADPVKAGVRRAGRIKAVTNGTPGTLTVDDTSITNIPTGTTFNLSVVNPNGSITKYTGTTNQGSGVLQLEAGTAFDPLPNVNSVWLIDDAELKSQLFRVIGVEEEDDIQYKVTALAHNSSKYDTVEKGEQLITRTVSLLNEVPQAPTVASITQQLYQEGDQVLVRINVYWKPVNGVSKYEVRWRLDDSNYEVVQVQTGTSYAINNARKGPYTFKIISLSATDKRSVDELVKSFTALGKQALPSTVKGFNATADAEGGIELTWSAPDSVKTGTYVQQHNSALVTATIVSHGFTTGDQVYINIASATGQTSREAFSPASSGTFVVTSTGTDTFTFLASDTNSNDNSEALEGAIDTGFADLDIVGYEVQLSAVKEGILTSSDFASADFIDNPASTFIESLPVLQATNLRSTTFKITSLPDKFTGTSGAATLDSNNNLNHGSVIYTIKAIDAEGNYSSTASKVGITLGALGQVQNLTSLFIGENVALTWAAPDTVNTYSVVDTFNVLRTSRSHVSGYKIISAALGSAPAINESIQTTEYVTKVLHRSRSYVIKAINFYGGEGEEKSITVASSAPEAPSSLGARVIDNTVFLSWTKPASNLPIIEYQLQSKKDGEAEFTSITGGGIDTDSISALFFLHAEVESGTYSYRVRAVDSTGLKDANFAVTENVVVNAPRDFTLAFDENSTLNENLAAVTVSNGVTEVATNGSNEIVFAFDNTETWATHFTGNSQTTLQGFIDDGFTKYLSPTETAGFYQQTFDLGTAISDGQINIAQTIVQILGTTTVSQEVSFSLDNTTFYSVSGDNPFINAKVNSSDAIETFRYLRVKVNFASTGNNTLARLTGMEVQVARRTITIEGSDTVTSVGIVSKVVNLTGLTRLNSVVVTPKGSATAVFGVALYSETVPSSFGVNLFNADGDKITGDFSYLVRGQA